MPGKANSFCGGEDFVGGLGFVAPEFFFAGVVALLLGGVCLVFFAIAAAGFFIVGVSLAAASPLTQELVHFGCGGGFV